MSLKWLLHKRKQNQNKKKGKHLSPCFGPRGPTKFPLPLLPLPRARPSFPAAQLLPSRPRALLSPLLSSLAGKRTPRLWSPTGGPSSSVALLQPRVGRNRDSVLMPISVSQFSREFPIQAPSDPYKVFWHSSASLFRIYSRKAPP
jgi:hypothetical protein